MAHQTTENTWACAGAAGTGDTNGSWGDCDCDCGGGSHSLMSSSFNGRTRYNQCFNVTNNMVGGIGGKSDRSVRCCAALTAER